MKKGQMAIGNIMMIGLVPIILVILAIVYFTFAAAIPTSTLGTQGAAVVERIGNNTKAGFDLASILPLALAGVVILITVVGAFAYLKTR